MATKDVPRPKIRGEHEPVVMIDGLPSKTLSQFRREILNKPNENDRVSERTAESYVRNIRVFFEYLRDNRQKKPLEADTSDLRQFLRHYKSNGDSDYTLKTRRSAVSRFYSELSVMARDDVLPISEGDCPPNPEEGYDATWSVNKTEKERHTGDELHYFTPKEVKMLCQNVPAAQTGGKLRNRLIVRMLYQTGMRVSELTHVRVNRDIDREKHEISVPSISSKSGGRLVAYKSTLDSDLRRWLDGGHRDSVPYADESPYLFPTNRSERISTETVRRIIREAADNAGLDNPTVYTDNAGRERSLLNVHSLRHSMAINTLESGAMNVRELQEFLGHAELETTEQYLKIAADGAVDAYKDANGPPEGD